MAQGISRLANWTADAAMAATIAAIGAVVCVVPAVLAGAGLGLVCTIGASV